MINFLIIALVVLQQMSNAVPFEIVAGSAQNLPTKENQVKNEEIVYQHRSFDAPFERQLNFTIKNLVLSQDYSLQWFRGEEELKINTIKAEEASVSSKTLFATYQAIDERDLLISLRISDFVAKPGLYTLKVTQDNVMNSASIAFNSAPILPTYNKPKRVLEGDSIRISCTVSAHPPPKQVLWSFAHVNPDADVDAIASAYEEAKPLVLRAEDVSFPESQPVQQDVLKFTSLKFEDNGVYICTARNDHGNDTTVVYLNIKNRWAALWPFIGVVVEVSALVTIILLFEKRLMRSKKPKADGKSETANLEAEQKLKEEKETPITVANSNHVNENEQEAVDETRQRTKNV